MTEQALTDKKKHAEAIPLLISDFPAGESIAKELIRAHHDTLVEANIIFLCRNISQISGGRPVPGSVKKASPIERYLGGHLVEGDGQPDFIITVSLEQWNDLNPVQRKALIDHLLSRCQGVHNEKSGETKYKVRPPPVQEFPEIVERYGRWNDDLIDMGNSLKGT